MRVNIDSGEKRTKKKASVLKAVWELIENYPSEYHPYLYNALIREADIMVADSTAGVPIDNTKVPILMAVVNNTAKNLSQVVTDVLEMDFNDRTRLAGAMAKQIQDLKAVV